MSRLRRETLAKHPDPPSTPLEALAHVLAIYEELPDGMAVIGATSGIYPDTPWTGLRLGDLRSLLDDHAHELAEKIRNSPFEEHLLQKHQRERAARLIDPKKEGQ